MVIPQGLEDFKESITEEILRFKCVAITGQVLEYNDNASNKTHIAIFNEFIEEISSHIPKKYREHIDLLKDESARVTELRSSLLEVRKALKHSQLATDLSFNDRIQKRIWESEISFEPNKIERLITSLKFRYYFTGSFGYNFEKAAEKSGNESLFLRSYGLSDVDKIASSMINRTSGIIHYSGKAGELTVDNFPVNKGSYSHLKNMFPALFDTLKKIISLNSLLLFDFVPSDKGFEFVQHLFKESIKTLGAVKNTAKPKLYYVCHDSIREKDILIPNTTQYLFKYSKHEDLLNLLNSLCNNRTLSW